MPISFRSVVIVLAVVVSLTAVGRAVAEPSSLRRTAIVRAIERARPAVVSIHGRKTLRASRRALGTGEAPRRGNGVGTGVGSGVGWGAGAGASAGVGAGVGSGVGWGVGG